MPKGLQCQNVSIAKRPYVNTLNWPRKKVADPKLLLLYLKLVIVGIPVFEQIRQAEKRQDLSATNWFSELQVKQQES